MSNRKFLASAIILILIIGIGAWLLASKKVLKPPVPPVQPTTEITEPQILSLEATKLKRDLVRTAKKSGDLILEESSNFQIKYLISNDEFIAHVKSAPFAEHKKAAEQWFIDKGFGAQDLCLLQITFTVPKDVKPDFSALDVVPTGCSVVPHP